MYLGSTNFAIMQFDAGNTFELPSRPFAVEFTETFTFAQARTLRDYLSTLSDLTLKSPKAARAIADTMSELNSENL